MGKRALLIAPSSDLPYVDQEVQRVANALHPELLFGTVDTATVLDKLATGSYEIVWFACHGTPEGIILTDGVLEAPKIVQMLRPNPPQVLVLNTCSSIQVAMQVHDELNTAVICTVLGVPDRDAFVTGSLLAQALGQGKDIQEAYQLSRPGHNRQYVILNGAVQLNGKDRFDDTHKYILEFSRDLYREIAELKAQQQEMRNEIGEMRKELTQGKYHIALDKGRAIAWMGGFAMFTAAVFLMSDDVRLLMDLRWWTALTFSGLCAIISLVLFIYGIGFRFDK